MVKKYFAPLKDGSLIGPHRSDWMSFILFIALDAFFLLLNGFHVCFPSFHGMHGLPHSSSAKTTPDAMPRLTRFIYLSGLSMQVSYAKFHG
jgi:hypothetical protein